MRCSIMNTETVQISLCGPAALFDKKTSKSCAYAPVNG